MKFLKVFFTSFLVLLAITFLLETRFTPLVFAQGKDKPHKAVCEEAGKDSFRCHSHVIINDKGNPQVNTSPVAYGPMDLQHAYKFNGLSSSSKILAIVDAYDDPNIQQDLTTYSQTFGLPILNQCSGTITAGSGPCFQKVDQNGGLQYPSVDSGWGLEISLDVEVAHGMCQDCNILLVEANSSSYTDLMTAVDRAVKMGAIVVSNSYGSNEFNGETNFDNHFNKNGVAFTFSSGDNGYGTSYPAASRYVTSVGGTSLYLNSDGSYNSEYVWSGTGSGCSYYESKPSWQPYLGCSRRIMNDVAADANPNTGAAIYDTNYYGNSGWFQVGGTSLSSPIIAAAYALKGIPINYSLLANSLPYHNNPSYANLHDVVSGSNGYCGRKTPALCHATVGFDGPSGLGTPNGINAF